MDTKDDAAEAATDAAHGTGAEATPTTDEAAAAELTALAAAIAKLEAERDEAVANGQRAMADYQNLRRRTQADIDAAVKRARGELLTEALTVLDYLDMALATECTTEEARNLQMGVAMTRGQLTALLERFRVKEIPHTSVFDAAKHQAFATVETADHEPGSIVETFRKGWTMGDTVLRHAQVRVAAVPKAAATAESNTQQSVEGVADESSDRVSD